MAAVICKSIGDLCSGCGDLLCLPCKACGIGCNHICDAVSSPFFPYILITFGLNIAPFALGLMSVEDLGLESACNDEATWMVVNGIFCFIHMLACLYIVYKIRNDEQVQQQDDDAAAPAVQASDNNDTKKNQGTTLESGTFYQKMYPQEDNAAPGNSWGRVKHVMCYDKGVALYIILAIVWIIYQTMGVSKYFSHDEENCGQVGDRMLTSVFCGWFYMSFVGFAFLCSMCCMRL